MNIEPKDDLDRVIDEASASMVAGEPRRVSAGSVREAMGKRGGFGLPVWLAAAAVLIVGLGVALKYRAPAADAPAGVAQVVPTPSPAEVPLTTASRDVGTAGQAPPRASARTRLAATTTEPLYEGLPRLTIKAIDLPEPLVTARLVGDPIQLPSIDIAPLSIATLSNEHEPNQEQ